MQNQDLEIVGLWWRFTDYQIFEAPKPQNVHPHFLDYYRYIRPAPGAELETFPVRLSFGKEVIEDEGNQQTVSLDEIWDIDLEDEGDILRWCRKFGLLGILPQRAILLRLAPRWKPLLGENDPCLFPTQASYSRTNVGWSQVAKSTMMGKRSKTLVLDEEHSLNDWLGRLVDSEDTDHFPPTAILSKLFSAAYEERPLGQAVGQYFPDLPYGDWDTPDYPMPLSDPFWRQYGESLGEFRSAILRFRRMVGNLEGLHHLPNLPEEALGNLGQARSEIHSLMTVSPALGITEDGRVGPAWAFASLLSMFAFSVWQNLVGGQSVRHCVRARCRKVFISGNSRRQYCSDRCRQTEEKARQRTKG